MRISATLFLLLCAANPALSQQEIPKVADPRLVVELVAQAPDIVHPISCDFDHKGRLLVIESHTHFAPKDYKGPKFDRIRAFDVKTGKATTFFEGTRHTMDLAVHPNGSVYLATRNEILRLRETKDGVKSERIVFLDTKGDYPHNGLSGLCFDSKGDLTFGMGENLGAFYTLIGADGVKFTGAGDGGHIFHCSADGKNLRKVATGFWNPFGICRDIYGRTFCVDNDPDQAPPCRMVHVVEGGDYGFRFCYGRSGKHPFQSWHGELPGTLPMMTGVGEAPCEILSYESDGLPKEYLGKLVVTSWADHRVEMYKVVPHGASFKAERQPFVQGGNNFRPVGLCVAPDGSLYVTDWVLSNYNLHGKGAIWRIRWKDAPKPERPTDPTKAFLSDHWPLREWAAKKLADDGPNRGYLIARWAGDGRAASASLDALINSKDSKPTTKFLEVIAKKSTDSGMQEMALRELVRRLELKEGVITEKSPSSLRVAAMKATRVRELLDLIGHDDPFVRHAAIQQLAQSVDAVLAIMPEKEQVYSHRSLLLAQRLIFSARTEQRAFLELANERVRGLLQDADEEVRFLAVKWIADEKLKENRKDVEKLMTDPKLSVRMYMACATALARLDGKEVNEKSLADYFAARLADDKTPAAQLPMLLRQVPANHPKMTIDLLTKLFQSKDEALKMESLRALVEHPSPKRDAALYEIFEGPNLKKAMRAYATIGISDRSPEKIARFVEYADAHLMGDDVLRNMIGVTLTRKQLQNLEQLERDDIWADSIRRVLGKPFYKDRPPHKDIDAWMKRLEGKADPNAGARVFFHPKLAGCSKCHRIDGRGQDIGPDLSNIGRTERR
ncbi:MAG: hypothetical protein HY289_15375, partial [Planctomycetes bacterium]|nr:hypothetical protein [Planctomycetota bacterium]